jgi:hypothetical protein
MANWRNGYHCSDCKNVEKHGGHDQSAHGNWAHGGSGTKGVPATSAPKRRTGTRATSNTAGPATGKKDDGESYLERLGIPTGNQRKKPSNNELSQRAIARAKREREKRVRPNPGSQDENPMYFKCATGCGTPMEHWRDGNTCGSCLTKAAAKTGVKPAAGAKTTTGSAGNVQSEFPSCPSCGSPTADGTKCDDCVASGEQERMMGDLTIAQTHAQFEASLQDQQEEEERRSIRQRARARMAQLLGLDEDVKKAAAQLAELPPVVLKANTEKRFSYAPMYMPGRLDAHGEFVKSATELQEAAWEYVRKTGGDRQVFLQHIDKPAGEWVEITSWPYAVEAPMHMPNGTIRKATFPAGTVYMGVVWEPWAYDMVKKGKLLGFSMGGWAKRVEAQLADEDVTKAAGSDTGPVVNPDSPARFGAMDPYDHEATMRALGLR